MKPPLYIAIIFSVFLISGCQGSSVPTQSANITEPPSPQQIVPQTPTQAPTDEDNGVTMPELAQTPDPATQNLVRLATENLAQKLQIDAAQIRVVTIESVTWPDASLGCPQLGVSYIQVLTPGYKIVLEASGKTYPYHTNEEDQVILCALRPGGEYFISPTP